MPSDQRGRGCDRILAEMAAARWHASLPVMAYALLAAVLAAVGAWAWDEAVAAALAVALAFLPSGWWAPTGARRRAAEAVVLLPALAMVLLADPTLRRMAVPPLLVLAALAATSAAMQRTAPRFRPWLVAALALSARAAGALGLLGTGASRVALVTATVGALPFAASLLAGPPTGIVVALLAGTCPLERMPFSLLAALLAAGVGAAAIGRRGDARRLATGWLPGALAIALLASAVAAWGGIAPTRALPNAGLVGGAATGAALLVTPWLPPAAAGAAWLAATLALGATQPPPPDRAALRLDATRPRVALPQGDGHPYMLEAVLRARAPVPNGTSVATLRAAGHALALRAGTEVSVSGEDGHAIAPASPVWWPAGVGFRAEWEAMGRSTLVVPPGVIPEVELAPGVSATASLAIATAGPSRPSPPRDWPLPRWLLFAAVVLALLQLLGRSWHDRTAALPWALLTAGSLAARLPVEPLHLLAERHAVDLALAALVLAWWPAARRWLREGRVFATAAALLVPLAIATPHLTPPVGDETYHLLLLRSLRHDADLDISNNFDLEHYPQERIYVPFAHHLLHSPVLACLLLPGYLVAGRTGATVLLALAGAALVALLHRQVRRLGLSPPLGDGVTLAVLLGYPLATFATELWVELPGALLVALSLAWISDRSAHPVLVALAAVLGTALKTRLGLVLVPLVAVAWWPRRWRWRELRLPLLVGSATAVAGLAAAWALVGDPLDPMGRRTLASLLPHSAHLAVTALGGLAFDPAGGLLFAAPLALVAAAGAATLARSAERASRALVAGVVATLVPLLNLVEWRGGDAPPARYLVPLVPAAVWAGACWLGSARRTRPLVWLLLPPTCLASWVFVTRPHLAINAGDGGFWLADALAHRFVADARHMFPSFLRPSAASWMFPAGVAGLALALMLAAARSPALARGMRRAAISLWLAAAALFVVALTQRYDHVVDLEDPQIERLGGTLEPPPGTFSRFTVPNGWRVADGEGVEASLRLPPGAQVRIEGWPEGAARGSGSLLAAWDGGPPATFSLQNWPERPLWVSAPAEAGKHRLRLLLRAPEGGQVVLSRAIVSAP